MRSAQPARTTLRRIFVRYLFCTTDLRREQWLCRQRYAKVVQAFVLLTAVQSFDPMNRAGLSEGKYATHTPSLPHITA